LKAATNINDNTITTSITYDRDSLLERKVGFITEGLTRQYAERLYKIRRDNALAIVDFISSMKTEINPSLNHIKNNIMVLTLLSQFHNNQKSFKQMTREDVLSYLDKLRKPEPDDPLHRWIGTYNAYRTLILKFFKWVYYPDLQESNRPRPPVLENIPQLKRKEQSIYKPSDLWTIEDDILFLKYCPSIRDKCYHMISRDTGCKPHEILKLKVKDVVFKTSGNNQYAEVLVNGKTGSRHIPLINSIPYVKDWLSQHPQQGNPNAPLICGYNKSLGRRLNPVAITQLYKNQYKKGLFAKLLDNPSVSVEDKQKIKELLRKPWNPYIRRHSALTEKSTILKEHILRQYAGWSGRSQMPQKYLHYFGNESSESLLEAYGIITKDKQLSNVLKPKQCPNCNEPNKPDSKFCAKCRMVLSYDAYSETLEKQNEEKSQWDELRKEIDQIKALLKQQS
jgi:integrase